MTDNTHAAKQSILKLKQIYKNNEILFCKYIKKLLKQHNIKNALQMDKREVNMPEIIHYWENLNVQRVA